MSRFYWTLPQVEMVIAAFPDGCHLGKLRAFLDFLNGCSPDRRNGNELTLSQQALTACGADEKTIRKFLRCLAACRFVDIVANADLVVHPDGKRRPVRTANTIVFRRVVRSTVEAARKFVKRCAKLRAFKPQWRLRTKTGIFSGVDAETKDRQAEFRLLVGEMRVADYSADPVLVSERLLKSVERFKNGSGAVIERV